MVLAIIDEQGVWHEVTKELETFDLHEPLAMAELAFELRKVMRDVEVKNNG